MQKTSTSPVRIGLWGLFDAERLGEELTLRITRHELMRRLPQATVRPAAPFGYLNPGCFDGADPVEPLGAWSDDRAAELGEGLDCVVVAGEAIRSRFDDIAACYPDDPEELRPDRFFIEGPARAPVLWSAVGVPFDLTPDQAVRVKEALVTRSVVTVRDEASRLRLEASGVDGEVEVVPDPVVLAARLFTPEVIDRRIRYLRHMGWYPRSAPALVVEVSRRMATDLAGLTRAVEIVVRERPELEVVVVPTEPCGGDDAPVTALTEALGVPARRLPPRLLVEDVAAAAAHADAFVGATAHGTLLALAFDRPAVLMGEDGPLPVQGIVVRDAAGLPEALRAARAEPPTAALERLRDEADRHFDGIAEVAGGTAAPQEKTTPERRIAELEERLRLLERAHEARGRRLVADAARFADLRREAELLRGSRTFRYTAWIRRLLGRRR